MRSPSLCVIVLLWCAQQQGAHADNPFDEPAPVYDDRFDRSLDVAKTAYFEGREAEALALFELLFERLSQGEPAEHDAAAEATIYLGEIYVRRDRRADAEKVFRWVLERDADTPISPYNHPADVVALFDLVRTSVQGDTLGLRTRIPAPSLGPPPWWTYAPLGVPQFGQRRTGAGVLYGGLQVGLVAASVALLTHLDNVNVPEDEHPRQWTAEQIAINVQGRRWGAQWPTTIAFYALWGLSSVDAHRFRRNEARLRLRVIPIAAGQPGLSAVGTF